MGKILGQELFLLFTSKETIKNKASADSEWYITPVLTFILHTGGKITAHSSQLLSPASHKAPVLPPERSPLVSTFSSTFTLQFPFQMQSHLRHSCHASAHFCCFHCWVSREDYGSSDQSMQRFASIEEVT